MPAGQGERHPVVHVDGIAGAGAVQAAGHAGVQREHGAAGAGGSRLPCRRVPVNRLPSSAVRSRRALASCRTPGSRTSTRRTDRPSAQDSGTWRNPSASGSPGLENLLCARLPGAGNRGHVAVPAPEEDRAVPGCPRRAGPSRTPGGKCAFRVPWSEEEGRFPTAPRGGARPGPSPGGTGAGRKAGGRRRRSLLPAGPPADAGQGVPTAAATPPGPPAAGRPPGDRWRAGRRSAAAARTAPRRG